MLDDVLVAQREVALSHAQIVNGVQQIGFAHTICPDKAVEAITKMQLLRRVVLELNQFQSLEIQCGGSFFVAQYTS